MIIFVDDFGFVSGKLRECQMAFPKESREEKKQEGKHHAGICELLLTLDCSSMMLNWMEVGTCMQFSIQPIVISG